MKEVEYVLLIFLDSSSQNENSIILHRSYYPDYLGKMDEKYSTNSYFVTTNNKSVFYDLQFLSVS